MTNTLSKFLKHLYDSVDEEGEIRLTTRGFKPIKGMEKYFEKDLHLPKRQTKYAAGYDFECATDTIIPKASSVPTLVPTYVKSYMGEDEYLELVNRSSNPMKLQLVMSNGVGIIDSDYYENPDNDGHIMFQFVNLSPYDILLKKGERIGQGIFHKYLLADDDNTTESRSGGFGSTGK